MADTKAVFFGLERAGDGLVYGRRPAPTGPGEQQHDSGAQERKRRGLRHAGVRAGAGERRDVIDIVEPAHERHVVGIEDIAALAVVDEGDAIAARDQRMPEAIGRALIEVCCCRRR